MLLAAAPDDTALALHDAGTHHVSLLINVELHDALAHQDPLAASSCGKRMACAQAYTTFFCRQNEPSYVKSLKLEILVAVADAENAHAIVTELSEYVGDIDEQLAREAVRAVGRIALDVRPHAMLTWCMPCIGLSGRITSPAMQPGLCAVYASV